MSGSFDDTLTLVAAGQSLTGWQAVQVARGVERLPSSFEIVLTERYPGEADAIVVEAGDPCEVWIGSDRVLTGYIDRYAPEIGPGSHEVRISGRSKCQDLVDCSAVVPGSQLGNTDVLSLAQSLARPFGIEVTSLAGSGLRIPQFNVNLGESPWDIIERVTRFAALLAYDGPDGNLILAQAGQERMASGFAQGWNVQQASSLFGMDERFSDYQVVLMSMDTLHDLGPGSGNLIATATDNGVKAKGRYRPKIIVSEQASMKAPAPDGTLKPLGELRAAWEAARRFGRSQAVRLTCDGWRDAAGRLWEPNAHALVDLPALKIVRRDWVISEVEYLRSDSGTTALVTLMPQSAFQPEPELVQAFDAQVAQALLESASGGSGYNPRSPLGPS